MISGRPGATAKNIYCRDLHEYMAVTKTCSLPRFDAVFTWGSGTLEEMWRTRFHRAVRNWESAWILGEKSHARGGYRVFEHEQTGVGSGRAGTAPARKDRNGPSRVSWSNCLAATITSTRKHQAAFRKVCLSAFTPSENGFFSWF